MEKMIRLGGFNASWLQNLREHYSNQNHVVLAQRQAYRPQEHKRAQK